jgi:hypothetical protein
MTKQNTHTPGVHDKTKHVQCWMLNYQALVLEADIAPDRHDKNNARTVLDGQTNSAA